MSKNKKASKKAKTEKNEIEAIEKKETQAAQENEKEAAEIAEIAEAEAIDSKEAETEEKKEKEIKRAKGVKGVVFAVGRTMHDFFEENMLVVIFIISSVLNAFLLRAFTVKFNYNQVKPLLADIGACLVFGSIGVLAKKRKRQFIYLLVLTIIFAVISAGNSIYYTNYKSFMSISLISTASQLGGVMDAVTKNIMEPKDLLFLWSIPALIVCYILVKRRNKDYLAQVRTKKHRRISALATFGTGLGFLGICATMLTTTDYSRLQKQWNREYVLATFGLYTYHVSDIVSCTNAQLNMIFGYTESEELFNKFYDNKNIEEASAQVKKNKYSNMFTGKNIMFIHAESIQGFTLDTYMNGEPLTPTINKLAREGIYFTNFYAQESVGTTSDTEFTLSTSLMPASSGTVAINYWDRDYTTTQKLLKEKDYYVFSMHGNNGSYWNRLNVHKSYGYDRFYNSSTDFNIDETIGLGLSDKSMFRQAIPIIKDIDKNNKNWMAEMLMLTNHTPFTDIERVSDFKVDFKYKKYNEETGRYDEVSAPFLEGRKLGSYFKSVHYADEAIGQLLGDMDKEGLLENTVIVLYGDHDAKVKESEFDFYYNYDPFNDKTLSESDPGYIPVDPFCYNVNRKVPLIIWSKQGGYEPCKVDKVMGMYDVQPTIGNMMGFENKYALGHDIFSIPKGEENVVIFPNGNFVTDTVYYDNQKDTYFDITKYRNVAKYASCNQIFKDEPSPLYNDRIKATFKTTEDPEFSKAAVEKLTNNDRVSKEYIKKYSDYTDERINISNAIIYFDMINKTEEGFSGSGDKKSNNTGETDTPFTPPSIKSNRYSYAV